ncbi:MAG: sulfite reductase [Gammaproteobacteria bacterium]|nr:sulfite reductase [Gammaproteobacteria bacterium]|tara:strand:+ start:55446 stop:57104 length:1659 start_codon:yes stop_codon:yes gene_type:complete
MYTYDKYDHQMLEERVAQFRDQTRRFLDGKLTEQQFLPLRLQNGLYVQRLAPMLRIAVPYGLISSKQMRKLASITRDYDKGYAHLSTRQNVQINWPKLEQVPDILAELAEVSMHAIQTSGNCIRNTTTDQFAGVSPNEIEDSRPWCEIIRQWSTFHPEFAYLPRKFKIAVCGTEVDQAATQVHDIGLYIKKNDQGELGFQVLVGGGLGRTPLIGQVICEFLPWRHLLTYLDAIMRVYNMEGRRDNIFKARIKILVKALGIDTYREKVEALWQHTRDGEGTLTEEEVARCKAYFTPPAYADLPDEDEAVDTALQQDLLFQHWVQRNVAKHKQPGYRIVTLSLKETGVAPGDLTDRQMEFVADLADRYSFSEMRITHEQNLTLADVRLKDLYEVYKACKTENLATANLGLLNDIISCPGGDYCSLANAKSIPIAESIQRRFDDFDRLTEIGDISLNISGCMNACGHHHVGNIGILGVDKKGEEFYQVSLGGDQGREAKLAKVLGPSFAQVEIPDVVEKIVSVYLEQRQKDEKFIDTYQRLGIEPFKERVYAKAD